jgi:hypothetical protein
VPTYARRSARVLLIDGQDRLLLLRFLNVADRPDRGHQWLTPGGKMERGEDLPTPATRARLVAGGRRAAPAALRHVAFTSGQANFSWAKGLFRDDFLLYRVAGHVVDTSRQTSLERRHDAGHRWWTAGDLAATTETVYPNQLAALMRNLLIGQIPATPVELPWHH